MDEAPSQLPLLVRVALRCHPAWWREHYGLDAASTAGDLNKRGASPGLQGLTLLLSAASAHLRGPRVLKQSASEALVEAVEFHPSVRWRIVSIAALTFLLVGLGGIGFLALRGLLFVFEFGPGYIHRVSTAPIAVSFNVVRAASFFIPLVVFMIVIIVEILALLRAKPPRSPLSQLVGTSALLLVIFGCAGVFFLFFDHLYGRYASIDELGRIAPLWKVLAGVLLIIAVAIAGWLISRWNRPRIGSFAISVLALVILMGVSLWSSGSIAGWQSGYELANPTNIGYSYATGFWNAAPISTTQTELSQILFEPSAPQCVTEQGCYIAGGLSYGNSNRDSFFGRSAVLISLVHLDGRVEQLALINNFHGGTIACWATTHCVIAGYVPTGDGIGYLATVTTTDGWQSWSINRIDSPNLQGFASGSVACTSTGHCLLAGVRNACGSNCSSLLNRDINPISIVMLSSDDGGATWTKQSSLPDVLKPGTAPIVQNGTLQCATDSSCWFFSGGDLILQCPASGSCVPYDEPDGQGDGLGGSSYSWAYRTTDGGASWTQVHFPSSAPYVEYVDCTTERNCQALSVAGLGNNPSAYFLTSMNDGSSWVVHPFPLANRGFFSQLYCSQTSNCWVAESTSSQSTIFHTLDGGSTWSERQLPFRNVVDTIGCKDDLHCVGTGFRLGTDLNRLAQQPLALLTSDGWRTSFRGRPA
jgi:hypothetical protein